MAQAKSDTGYYRKMFKSLVYQALVNERPTMSEHSLHNSAAAGPAKYRTPAKGASSGRNTWDDCNWGSRFRR